MASLKDNALKSKISKDLRTKANEFLNNTDRRVCLDEIIQHLRTSIRGNMPLTPTLLTLEVVFVQMLKQNRMKSLSKDDDDFCYWLRERYADTWSLMLEGIISEKSADSIQCLTSCMKILAAEGKSCAQFPKNRLRHVLDNLMTKKQLQTSVIQSFKQYNQYLDVVEHSWSLLSVVFKKYEYSNEISALNTLEFINVIPLNKTVQGEAKFLVQLPDEEQPFDYNKTRRCINKVWNGLMQWLKADIPEMVHKQMLIALIECFLAHLEKPVLLTDFLMDSLDCGGAISLLALQGVFTLIQKHNITYPDIYQKLYSMFEPDIFHTKFKARLFYLADIFLSSTHLPENLVAAFVKRLSRLSLICPPQDAVIILYFIGNLLLRHVGLKRLICATMPEDVSQDPYTMEEREPTKSNALESSLWEIIALQKHAVPLVATAARFISLPMPGVEWDLSSVLETKEDDIFDQELKKMSQQCHLNFERPQDLFLSKGDKFNSHWSLL